MNATLLLVSIITVLIATHIRPLNAREIKQLGIRKRSKQISRYFSFQTEELEVDKEFKKQMNPNGKFYEIDENLYKFPSVAAALLKYKKHEWIIVAFEKQKKIDLIWLNKGFNRSRVSLYLPIVNISSIVKQKNYTSILIFHNHPNPDPNHYDCSRPSDQDLESANELAYDLNTHGINLVEFVCEKGVHYKYFLSSANSFFPLSSYVIAIDEINGLSRMKNLLLHIKRIF